MSPVKILLVRPPLAFANPYQLDSMGVGLPLGLLYVAAMLEKENINVSLFDGLVNFDLVSKEKRFKEKIRQRDWGHVHFGAEWDEIRRHIRENAPHILGITNHFTEEIDMAFKVAQLAKEVDGNIFTIIGGPFASTCPEELLKREPSLDMVIVGEGEYTVPEVVKAISDKKDLNLIEGVAYRSDGKIIVTRHRPYIRDLDALRYPAYHLVDMERYFYFQNHGYSTRRQIVSTRKVPVITSRGCPFNCTFCCVHLHMGKVWRPHSPEYVLGHIDFLIKNFRAEHILFEDDNINLNPSRFENLLDGLIERDYKILWDTPNGIRADKLNGALIRKAKKSGCLFLKIGIESGDQYVVNKIVKKHLDLKKVIEVARLCKKSGVTLEAFFIIGFPGETKKEITNTVNFSLMLFRKFNVVSAIGPAKPLMGTELRRECVERGYLTEQVGTPDMAERLIARQEMIKTEDFDLEYLFRVIRQYEFRRRLITIEKVFISSLRRPGMVFLKIFLLTGKTINAPGKIKSHLKETFNDLRREFELM